MNRNRATKTSSKCFGFFAMFVLAACGGEVGDGLDPPGESDLEMQSEELGTVEAALQSWGGSTPGSCLDTCLNLCPQDQHGGIEAGCLLTCLRACSRGATRATSGGIME